MSSTARHRVQRWYDAFPPRGAWRALGGLIAFGCLAARDLPATLAVIVAFAVAEVVFDAAESRR
ncbi:hypothetical protein [Nocardioides sp. TF02-7]|uniref:hypothetical protein n=1 Tax=Nocardioides sp. TF02-7 TaxID=2917724 RepID=UPI001F053D33|nr:hypothetical protein [Nocardioides sp. TF02-7]UMG91608.1 hypothetical protein MF408_16100 [Nocardioides sp. TF02-7]